MMRIGVTGHQDIPLDAIAYVTLKIQERLRQDKNEVRGYTALAAGSDQIFGRAVLEAGGKLVAVIPCKGYSGTFTTEKTLQEYRALISQAEEKIELPFERPSETAFLAAGRKVVDSSQCILAVWDGQDAKGRGGTADIVEYARRKNIDVVVIWPEDTAR